MMLTPDQIRDWARTPFSPKELALAAGRLGAFYGTTSAEAAVILNKAIADLSPSLPVVCVDFGDFRERLR